MCSAAKWEADAGGTAEDADTTAARRLSNPMMSHFSVRSAAIAALAFAATSATASAQWFSTAPANSPAPRSGAPFAFDALRNTCVLFGGSQPQFGAYTETWTFDGAEWTQENPLASPPGRGGAGMVFDAQRGVTVMFGGISNSPFGGSSYNDTWEWDGLTWTQRTTATTPFRSGRYGMAYDTLRGRTVVFGGVPSTLLLGASNQTWEYDGTNWQQRNVAVNPGALDGPAMCFSETLGTCVLFGGVAPVTGAMSTATWMWNGTAWTQANVFGSPPSARYEASMTFDPTRGVCVLHGGVTAGGMVLDDTWEFDGATWTLVSTGAPGPRRCASMAFDRYRGTNVLYGGSNSLAGGISTILGDTWTYGPSYAPFGSGCAGSSGVPFLSASIGPRLGQTFAPTIQNLVASFPLAVVALGFSDTSWSGVPLPLDMTSAGIPGCSLFVAADRIDVIAAQNGIGQQFLAIPVDPWFLGAVFYQQGFSFELPGFNAFGGVLSNAARARIGF